MAVVQLSLRVTASQLVGYAVRGQSKVSSSTRLMFCTYGVLLRVLLGDPELCGVTHVVLDEVTRKAMALCSVKRLRHIALLRLHCLRHVAGSRAWS